MKQVIDSNGHKIKGLFKDDNGAIIMKDDSAYLQSERQLNSLTELNNEVRYLREQMNEILGKLNGKY